MYFYKLIACTHPEEIPNLNKLAKRKMQNKKKLEMYQYDTDALAQGHPHPHAGILQKMKLKNGP